MKIFNYFSEKWLIRKLRLNSKILTSQTGKEIIAIDILPNISRSKGNQTMKVNRIEYHIKNS